MVKKIIRQLYQSQKRIYSKTDLVILLFVSQNLYSCIHNQIRNIFINSVDDDNQIVLEPLTNGQEKYENDYINASYINVSAELKYTN